VVHLDRLGAGPLTEYSRITTLAEFLPYVIGFKASERPIGDRSAILLRGSVSSGADARRLFDEVVAFACVVGASRSRGVALGRRSQVTDVLE
jgi:hypothetical protein